MRTLNEGVRRVYMRFAFFVLSTLLLSTSAAMAHDVTPGDAGYIQEIWGVHIIPFMYLGAKHMVTGYDHVLFLLGVVFFLYRSKDVAVYVSLFAVGHSITMLAGVWFGWGISSYIVDAIIGLSVVYKALDNLGAYQRWFGFQPNTKAATFIFGLFHGTGSHPHCHGVLAQERQVLRTSLHRQRRHDDHRLCVDGIPTHWLFRGRIRNNKDV